MTTIDPFTVERLVRINNLVADSMEKNARTRWLPWQVFADAFTAGAVYGGAIAALVVLVSK